MGQAVAEGVSGQAAVDAGRAVYLALHGAAAIRRGGGEALRRDSEEHGADGRAGDGPLPAAAVGGQGGGEGLLPHLRAADGGHGGAHLHTDGHEGAGLPHGTEAAGRHGAV